MGAKALKTAEIDRTRNKTRNTPIRARTGNFSEVSQVFTMVAEEGLEPPTRGL